MNKCQFIGRLTKDPELTFVASTGTGLCKFDIAVQGFKRGEVDYVKCVAFGKTGETIAEYFTKGGIIGVAGRLKTGSYDNKQGQKVYTTDMNIESFDFCGNNGGGATTTTNNSNGGYGASNNFEEEMTPIDDGDMPF